MGRLIRTYPFGSFLVLLLELVAIIGVSNWFRRPAEVTEIETATPKTVNVYRIGEAPRVTVNAEVEKTGVITIMAQSGGIVQNIAVKTGQRIAKGTTLLRLSSTYAGGNAPALQSQLAQKQLVFNRDTYDLQKSTIAKNKELAEQSAKNSEEMRRIVDQSLSRTNELISNSQRALDVISKQLVFFENQTTPTLADAATDENVILGLKQQQLSLLSALSMAEQASRSAQLQSSGDSPTKKLADLTKEVTLKQLDLQDKSLQLNLEVSELNYNLAQIQASLMAPTAPFAGVVERVHVQPGESVNPGASLVMITAQDQQVSLLAYVPQSLAQRLSLLEFSRVKLGDNKWDLPAGYVSREPTNNNLFGMVWMLADTDNELPKSKGQVTNPMLESLRDSELVAVELPIGHADTSSAFPFIPIDAVHQTPESSSVFVHVNGKAEGRVVKLGEVFGQYVEVKEGLQAADEIILERNVIAGDNVVIK